jgi:transposase
MDDPSLPPSLIWRQYAKIVFSTRLFI